MVDFTMQQSVFGLVLFDLCGVLFNWKFFDHAAHLSGALFGYLYVQYGRKLWAKVQKKLFYSRLK